MNPKNLNHRAKSTLTFTTRIVVVLAIVLICFSYLSIYHVLHPHRSIPPGYTLVKENIDFQSVDLVTEDGVRLSAWYTPPENGAVILLAHGYRDNRPEWVYALLAKKGYGVLAWDARAHGESDGEIWHGPNPEPAGRCAVPDRAGALCR